MRVHPLFFLPFAKRDHLDIRPLGRQFREEKTSAFGNAKFATSLVEEQVVVGLPDRIGEWFVFEANVTEDERWVSPRAVEDVSAEAIAGHEAGIPHLRGPPTA